MTPIEEHVRNITRRHFFSRGSHAVGWADCLIAATAFIEGATLATGNVKDYPMQEITVLNARK